MKKRLLFAVLPALLVLSGCKSPYSAAATNVKGFVEDTVAHEEIFGEAKEGGYLGQLQNPLRSINLDEDIPMAYQIHYNSVSDTLAIRFVAAIKNLGVTASWKRGVAGADGSEIRSKSFADGAQATEKYYTVLNDGNSTLEVGIPGDFEDYAGFVIYTLHDIPYTANKNAYVAAYLKLVNENDGEDFAQSDVLAVKIEMEDDFTSANAFTFSSTETHHFLQGKIEGNDETLLTATEYDSGDNVATYRELNLLTTDSFGSFYYAPTIFQYFGYDGFVKDTATAFFEGASLSGYNKPRFNGDYSISVSRSPLNKIKATTTVTVSVNFSTEYNTGGNGGLFIAGDDPGWSANTSYRLTYNDGNIWTGTFALTIGTYVKYIVGPWDGGAATRWESGDNHLITPSTTSISVQGWQ